MAMLCKCGGILWCEDCDETKFKDKMNCYENDKTKWIYVAGIFDVIANFRITKIIAAKKRRVVNPVITPSISIFSTKDGVVLWLKNNLGGSIKLDKKAPSCLGGKKWKCWGWSTASRLKIVMVLRNTIPYMKVRVEMAKLLLDLCENWETPQKPGECLEKKEVLRREKIYQKMKQLKIDEKIKYDAT